MRRHGVFYVLFLLLLWTCTGEAGELSIVSSGSAGTEGINHLFSLQGEDFSFFDFELGLETQFDSSGEYSYNPNYYLISSVGENYKLIAGKNFEHITSNDSFRLIKSDNFQTQTRFYSISGPWAQMWFFRNLPFKTVDHVDAWMIQGNVEIDPFLLRATELKYVGYEESGSSRVLEVEATSNLGSGSTAIGWQEDTNGEISLGFLTKITHKHKNVHGSLEWRKIESGFQSLFSENNKHASNRQGYHINENVTVGDLKFSWNFRRHKNMELTRNYNQHSFIVSAKEKYTEMEWRLEPTTAFILRYAKENVMIQVDAWNSTFRYANKYKELECDFRVDAKRRIYRLQLGSGRILNWRLIGKYDFMKKRNHYSVLVAWQLEQADLKLELGKYDRGNMAAGFHNSPSLCVSWNWKF